MPTPLHPTPLVENKKNYVTKYFTWFYTVSHVQKSFIAA